MALVAVKCVSAQLSEAQRKKAQLETAVELYGIVCELERGTETNGVPDLERKNFYSCIECCQGMQPYEALHDPMAIARQEISGVRAFSDISRKAMCANANAHTSVADLKQAVENEVTVLKFNREQDIISFISGTAVIQQLPG